MTQPNELAAVHQTPASIIKAKIAVMKGASGVGKSGHNKFHNYAYASDVDVLLMVQPLMVENGLSLAMWCTGTEGPDDNGNMIVHFAMQWQHEGGDVSDPLPWIGVAQDRDKQGRMQDKWFNKAATAAEKYFLLKQFHIPAGKEFDPDEGTEQPAPKAPPAPPKANGADKPVPQKVAAKVKVWIDTISIAPDEAAVQAFERTEQNNLAWLEKNYPAERQKVTDATNARLDKIAKPGEGAAILDDDIPHAPLRDLP